MRVTRHANKNARTTDILPTQNLPLSYGFSNPMFDAEPIHFNIGRDDENRTHVMNLTILEAEKLRDILDSQIKKLKEQFPQAV